MSDFGTKLASLWVNKSQNGSEYFSGDFTFGTQVQIWPNKFKRAGSKDPDYNLILVQKKKKEVNGEKTEASPLPKAEAFGADFNDIPF